MWLVTFVNNVKLKINLPTTARLLSWHTEVPGPTELQGYADLKTQGATEE